ncbi:MAG: MFS transporter [Simkaniaceae bacterium]|nr:MFS transporter [Simkaniaceae bacterium]
MINRGQLAIVVTLVFMVLYGGAVTTMCTNYIAGDLAAGTSVASYTVSYFGVGNAVAIPLAVMLFKRVGPKRCILWCMVLYIMTNYMAARAQTFPALVFYRFLQGFASGPIFILASGIMKTLGTKEQAERYLLYVLMSFVIGPSLGGALGGFLAYEYHWRLIFDFTAIVLTIQLIIFWALYRCISFPIEHTPFDGFGYFLYFFSSLGLCSTLILGQQLDWFRSPEITYMFFISLSLFIMMIAWCFIHPYPVLHLRMLKNLGLVFAMFQIAGIFATYTGMIVLLSLFLNLYVNYTATWVGIILGSMTVTTFLIMFAISKSRFNQSLITLGVGIVFLIASSFYTTEFNTRVDLFRIAVTRVMCGIGYALVLPPLIKLLLGSTKIEERLRAFTFFQLARVYSSALGAAVFTTLWDRRFYFYYSRLGSQLTPFNEATAQFFVKAKNFGLNTMQQVYELNSDLIRRAIALSLDDCFFLMGWIVLALLILLLSCYYKLYGSKA